MDALFRQGPIKLTTPGGAIWLREVISRTLAENPEYAVNHATGSRSPGFIAITSLSPSVEGSSHEIERIIGLTGVAGHKGFLIHPSIVGAAATAWDFWSLQMAQAGGADVSAGHMKFSGTYAVFEPGTLTADKHKEAVLAFKIPILSIDGLAAPYSTLASQAAPALGADAGVDQKFILAKLLVNGVEFQPESVTINFGITSQGEMAGSHVYPSAHPFSIMAPTFRFTVKDLTKRMTFSQTGTSISPTNKVVVYLQKLAPDGGRIAAATTAHIRAQLNGGLISIVDQAETNTSGALTFEARGVEQVISAALVDPFAWTAGVAIP